MQTLFQYVSPPSQCGYLPDQLWSLEYEMTAEMTPAEYCERLRTGWRRFGNMIFRPRCRHCRECRSLRVLAAEYRPNRSQRRAIRANEKDIELVIRTPSVTREKLHLYDRYHTFQSLCKGWPEHPAKDSGSYAGSFVDNPFATEEWCYYLAGELVAVGYVDVLPGAMSAIYFFYEPNLRRRSLGTLNVVELIGKCAGRNIAHLYLGYFVAGCDSLSYKANFAPNEVLTDSGKWVGFRSLS